MKEIKTKNFLKKEALDTLDYPPVDREKPSSRLHGKVWKLIRGRLVLVPEEDE